MIACGVVLSQFPLSCSHQGAAEAQEVSLCSSLHWGLCPTDPDCLRLRIRPRQRLGTLGCASESLQAVSRSDSGLPALRGQSHDAQHWMSANCCCLYFAQFFLVV